MKQGHNLGGCTGKTKLYPNLYKSFEDCILALHTMCSYLKSSQTIQEHSSFCLIPGYFFVPAETGAEPWDTQALSGLRV